MRAVLYALETRMNDEWVVVKAHPTLRVARRELALSKWSPDDPSWRIRKYVAGPVVVAAAKETT